MKRRILPVTATTFEALLRCLQANAPIIYLDNGVYLGNEEQVLLQTEQYDYVRGVFPARNGVFFSKGVDTDTCELSHNMDWSCY